MRQGQNSRRARGRNNSNRRSNLPNRNQTFDSNGPEVRIRGNAYQVHEKYLALARDSSASGDRVMSENYLQHAEHYYRIIQSMNEAYSQAQQQMQEQPRESGNGRDHSRDHREMAPSDGNGSAAAVTVPIHTPDDFSPSGPDPRDGNGHADSFGEDPRDSEGEGDSDNGATLSAAPEAAAPDDASGNGAEPPRPRRRRTPRPRRQAERTEESADTTAEPGGD